MGQAAIPDEQSVSRSKPEPRRGRISRKLLKVLCHE